MSPSPASSKPATSLPLSLSLPLSSCLAPKVVVDSSSSSESPGRFHRSLLRAASDLHVLTLPSPSWELDEPAGWFPIKGNPSPKLRDDISLGSGKSWPNALLCIHLAVPSESRSLMMLDSSHGERMNCANGRRNCNANKRCPNTLALARTWLWLILSPAWVLWLLLWVRFSLFGLVALLNLLVITNFTSLSSPSLAPASNINQWSCPDMAKNS